VAKQQRPETKRTVNVLIAVNVGHPGAGASRERDRHLLLSGPERSCDAIS
jgi:hypothetical protein